MSRNQSHLQHVLPFYIHLPCLISYITITCIAWGYQTGTKIPRMSPCKTKPQPLSPSYPSYMDIVHCYIFSNWWYNDLFISLLCRILGADQQHVDIRNGSRSISRWWERGYYRTGNSLSNLSVLVWWVTMVSSLFCNILSCIVMFHGSWIPICISTVFS